MAIKRKGAEKHVTLQVNFQPFQAGRVACGSFEWLPVRSVNMLGMLTFNCRALVKAHPFCDFSLGRCLELCGSVLELR